MTVPERPVRRGHPRRRFDLRAMTVTFGLAAVGLAVVGWVARMALDILERRPAWALVLVLGGAAAVLLRGRLRSGGRFAGSARHPADALAAATATTLDALEEGRTPRPEKEETDGEEATAVLLPTPELLGPDEFEQAIADLCRRDGCAEVRVVGGAGDLGADVLALTPDGRRVVIQCKRYSDGHRVGSQDLQRFGGTCFAVHEADVAVLVTSTGFTAPAVEYAEWCGIVCVDEERLRDWREDGGPAPWSPAPPGEHEPHEDGSDPADRAPC
ncbi:restriction endonuclease [Streptomyces olivaceus]|uniref:restriction endonuclease n=1 Tax=Streptomyces olivaceus TaxID=47716 RepID=UPI00363166D3